MAQGGPLYRGGAARPAAIAFVAFREKVCGSKRFLAVDTGRMKHAVRVNDAKTGNGIKALSEMRAGKSQTRVCG
jgi:hypothetical protein